MSGIDDSVGAGDVGSLGGGREVGVSGGIESSISAISSALIGDIQTIEATSNTKTMVKIRVHAVLYFIIHLISK